MCGILGSVNFEITQKQIISIKHRGPDRQSEYRDVCNNNLVHLAHTRLSIVDLSDAGNQPMTSDCANYTIVFNGEIYNHLELRKSLKKSVFKGHSDTETILYYIIENGIESICNFNGIFAFAFYDKQNKKAYIARDQFGVKPLYYSINGNSLIFSSEIRPIQLVLKSKMNSESLGLLLNLRYCPAPYTLYDNIYKLRPNHYMTIDLGSSMISHCIKPYPITQLNISKISFDEALDIYSEKIESAVNRQLMSDVEVGVMLSGGIDSAIVAGIASQKLPYKLKTFTVGFDMNHQTNEIDSAAETANHFGIEHYSTKIGQVDFFNTFSECSRIVEEPLATTSFIPMYYLSKLASEHVKVVLTGQGADEPLGGYGRYQGELLRDKYPNFIFILISKLLKLPLTKNETLLRGGKSLCIKNDIERFNSSYSLFTKQEIQKLTKQETTIANELISYYYNLLNCSQMPLSASRMMAIDTRMNLADDLLLYTDKITMNFSLECRVPLLDTDLVNFLESLPLEYKTNTKKTKIIHKAYAQKILPNNIINRPKLGFQSPTEQWFRESYSKIENMLTNSSNDLTSYISKKEIIKILTDHKKGYNKEKQIFMLLSLYYWINNN